MTTMSTKPGSSSNILLEKSTPLTSEEKALFGYFGVNAKIFPPFRILNPQSIIVGDYTSIRDGANIYAFKDISGILQHVDPIYVGDFNPDDYRYDARIEFGRANQVGRLLLMSCTASIILEDNVLFSERVYVGDNNHTYSHPHVPIMQQPNQKGRPIRIGNGSWIGVGAAILPGVVLGRNCIVGANSVCRAGEYPARSVIAQESAKVIFRKTEAE